MEFKLRKESQSMVEKIFMANERRGVVRAYQIPAMIRNINPDIACDDEELRKLVADHDPEGTSSLDLDSFNQIVMHFLLKQVRRESNEFSHKNLIALSDFTAN